MSRQYGGIVTLSPRRIFLLTYNSTARTQNLTPYGSVHALASAGGKTILTNH